MCQPLDMTQSLATGITRDCATKATSERRWRQNAHPLDRFFAYGVNVYVDFAV